ncbi:hypothetical protein ABK040_010773 [Willaertia magna]
MVRSFGSFFTKLTKKNKEDKEDKNNSSGNNTPNTTEKLSPKDLPSNSNYTANTSNGSLSENNGTSSNVSNSSNSSSNTPTTSPSTSTTKSSKHRPTRTMTDISDAFGTVLTEDETTTKTKGSLQTPEEIKRYMELILGKTKEWCSENDEVKAFRKAIRKAHYITENKSIERSDLLPPVYLTSDTTFDENVKFFCKVNLVGENFQKMVDCDPTMSADDFAENFINKINKSHLLNRKKEDWIFKATGTSEYIYGNERMIDFAVIRKCLKRGITRIPLNLMDKETVLSELDPYDMKLKTTDYDFEYKRTKRYEIPKTHLPPGRKHVYVHYGKNLDLVNEDEDGNNEDNNLNIDDEVNDNSIEDSAFLGHESLTLRDLIHPTSTTTSPSISTTTATTTTATTNTTNSNIITADLLKRNYISLWDMPKPFRIRINGVEHLKEKENIFTLENKSIYISAQVFLGGLPLTSCRVTKCVIGSRDPRFNQYITFPELNISELPRESKICFNIYCKNYSKNDPHLNLSKNSITLNDLVKLSNIYAISGGNSSRKSIVLSGSMTTLSTDITTPEMSPNINASSTSNINNNGNDTEYLDHEEMLLVESKKKKKEQKNGGLEQLPLGGINFQLFDYCGTLKQGSYCLRIHPYKEAKPILTSGENKSNSLSETKEEDIPPSISFCLEEYRLPVVYPQDEEEYSSSTNTEQVHAMMNILQDLKTRKSSLTRSLTNNNNNNDNEKVNDKKPKSPMQQRASSYNSSKKKTLPEHLRKRFEEYAAKKNSQYQRPPEIIEKKLDKILHYDPLKKLNSEERWICFTNRDKLVDNPKALSKFLLSVPWKFPEARLIANEYLDKWALVEPIDALELLDHNFGASFVREYSLGRLNQLSDQQLSDFLLQLVQTLKYEGFHDSPLTRFLLQRGLRSPNIIGHILFWHLKAEMYVNTIKERHGLILEEYLRNCGSHRIELVQQTGVLQQFLEIAENVGRLSDKEEIKEYTHRCLRELKHPPKFKLPLSPRMEVKGLIVEKCRVMSSKKKPLWLVFQNADETGDPIQVMFKAGDDLRQDLLTLQVLSIMDQLWKRKGIDLHMNPYGCICTGFMEGFIEIVVDSETVAGITAGDQSGISGALNAFSSDPLENWILRNNGGDRTSKDYEKAVQNFTRSCAGYCTATYVLGIGDRHNDNIMLSRKGDLFHIDFGHFLGNFKTFKGVYKRETAPFVFTPMYAQVMKSYDQQFGTNYYSQFEDLCVKAYQVLRENGNLLMNLFLLMLATNIPELQSVSDIKWLRKCLVLDVADDEAAEHMKKKIFEALTNTKSKLNDFFHIVKHN